MKLKICFLVLCACFSLFAEAQIREGRVVYSRTVQLALRSFNIGPGVASQLPKSRTDEFELLFNSSQSLWQYLPNASNVDPGTLAGKGVILRINSGANESSFQDFSKGTRVDQREVAARSYIVTDSIHKLNWKITSETKQVLNYTAFKATAQRTGTRLQVSMENGEMRRTMVPDTVTVVAWFTPDVPVPAGPEYGGQLPGLILELDTNNGQSVYRAVELSPKVNIAKIKEPKEGKKLTAADFQKEREKLLEEMRNNMPAGNVNRMN